MAKKQMQHIKTCAEYIHENACRAWVNGSYIADESANRCPNHETIKESSAYLCGVLDERKRKKTNADRIRNMTDEELAMFLCNFRSSDADEYICEGCKAKKHCRAGHAGTIDWLQQPMEVTHTPPCWWKI